MHFYVEILDTYILMVAHCYTCTQAMLASWFLVSMRKLKLETSIIHVVPVTLSGWLHYQVEA
jgi:hypothetical protein